MNKTSRPVPTDYRAISDYVKAMILWRKQSDRDFSLRRITKTIGGCSPALISQVSQGRRRLTRDRVPQFVRVLGLTRSEATYLDHWVTTPGNGVDPAVPTQVPHTRRRSAPQNHLLSHWLNIYVKDVCGLQGSRANARAIYQALGGIASERQIERSLKFLLAHGYLKRNLKGGLVKNEVLTTTTDDIPSEKIRTFHKRALDVAKRGIDTFPPDRRRANAMVISLTPDGFNDLRELLKGFHEQLLQFTEEHSNDSGKLYQVLLHLTPIGGFNE